MRRMICRFSSETHDMREVRYETGDLRINCLMRKLFQSVVLDDFDQFSWSIE